MGLHIWALNRKHLVPRPGDRTALVPTPRELPAQGVLWTLRHRPELRARDLDLKEVAKGGCMDPRGRTLGAELDQRRQRFPGPACRWQVRAVQRSGGRDEGRSPGGGVRLRGGDGRQRREGAVQWASLRAPAFLLRTPSGRRETLNCV